MDRQLKKEEDLVGKTISKIYHDSDYNLILFFTDDTWTVIEEVYPIGENYFTSPNYISRENEWRRKFARRIKLDSRITKDSFELTDLGREFVRLGYITENDIIKDWVLYLNRSMSSRVLATQVQLRDYREKNPEEDYKKALEEYKDLQKEFPEYLNGFGDKDLVFKEINL